MKGEQNASNPMVKRWQDVASTIERLKVKLDEDELDEDELDEDWCWTCAGHVAKVEPLF